MLGIRVERSATWGENIFGHIQESLPQGLLLGVVLGKDTAKLLKAVGCILLVMATLPQPVDIQVISHAALVSQTNLE